MGVCCEERGDHEVEVSDFSSDSDKPEMHIVEITTPQLNLDIDTTYLGV